MSIRIRPGEAGARVEVFLTARFSYHTAAAWHRLILQGLVLLNGAKTRPDTLIETGDVLAYVPESADEPPVDDRVSILLDDPDFAVVDKSGNLPCHPAGRYFEHTLWAILRQRFHFQTPIFVNRLDRETSGVVLIGKNSRAARLLGLQFERHLVEKRYVVWVEGLFPARLDVRGWLRPDTASPIRKKRRFFSETEVSPGGDRTETVFIREAFSNGISRLRALPRTGRTHQIRATLCSLGYPVVGDKLYGVDSALFLRMCEGGLTEEDHLRLRLPRQALHAASLRFIHPRTGVSLSVSAPIPEDLLGPMNPK